MARAKRENPEREGPERGPSWTDGFGWTGNVWTDQIRRSVESAYDLIRQQMKGDGLGLGSLPQGLFEWGQAEDAAKAFGQYTIGLAQALAGAFGAEKAMAPDQPVKEMAVAVQCGDGRMVLVRASLGKGAVGGTAAFLVRSGGKVPDIEIELLGEPENPPVVRVRVGGRQPSGTYDAAILGQGGAIAGTIAITVSD